MPEVLSLKPSPWVHQAVLTAVLGASLACAVVAEPAPPPASAPGPVVAPTVIPRPIPQPRPTTSTPVDNDLTVERPVGNLMLKNADQINLLNTLAMVEMSAWPSLLRRNHSFLNDEFVQVMGNRSQDAMRKAVSSYQAMQVAQARQNKLQAAGNRDGAVAAGDEFKKVEKARNGYVEISFRYALLADLTAREIHRPDVYRLQLAEAYARIKDGAPMAMAVVGNILITDPNNVSARLLSGRLREATGDMYGAMVDYQFVVKREPNNALAWTAIGKAHLLVSDFAKAKDALRKAVACTSGGSTDEATKLLYNLEHPQQLPPPSDPSLLPGGLPTAAETLDSIDQAAETALRENRVDEARKGFLRAISMDSTNAPAHMGLGDIYFRTSDFLKAIEEYNLAAKYSPSSPIPMRYMGLACEKMYDTTKAPVYLDRAIECVASAIRIKSDYAEARADQERLLAKKSSAPSH